MLQLILMQKYKRSKLWFIVGILLTGLLISGIWWYQNRNRNYSHQTDENAILYKVWKQKISHLGGAKAYQELKHQFANKPASDGHMSAHIFGEQLYQQSGLNGITVCDSELMYGCYHGFFTSAIVEKGTGIVPQLFEMCQKEFGARPTACEHGIGHGLYEYYGEKQLNQALEQCQRVQRNPLLGCSSGVFMEYNFPSFDLFSVQPRPVDKNNYYSPCDRVTNQFKYSCYYELPSRWSALKMDFSKIASLCLNLPDSLLQQACVRGTGLAASIRAEFNNQSAASLCNNFQQLPNWDLCIKGIYWGVLSRQSEAKAEPVCEMSTNKSACLYDGDLRHLEY